MIYIKPANVAKLVLCWWPSIKPSQCGQLQHCLFGNYRILWAASNRLLVFMCWKDAHQARQNRWKRVCRSNCISNMLSLVELTFGILAKWTKVFMVGIVQNDAFMLFLDLRCWAVVVSWWSADDLPRNVRHRQKNNKADKPTNTWLC